MNETLKVIENRRSVRNFAPESISEKEKQLILHACLRAPTAGNLMLYSILEVEDQQVKDQLAVSCDNQPFIAKAPLLLVFLADYQRMLDFYTYCDVRSACLEKGIVPRIPGEGDLLLACSDALIAAQTAVIAAESMGIGSCYIGDILEKEEFHRELLRLPQHTLPIALVVFGRPMVRKAENRLTPRFDPEFIIFKNEYHRLSEGDLQKMFTPSAIHNAPDLPLEEAIKTLGRNTYFRKFATEFSTEMTRSAKKWISAWAKNA